MEVPRLWRGQKERYGLIGDLCTVCDKPTFPPKDVCGNCTTEDLLKVRKENRIIYDSKNNITSDTPKPVEQVQD
jgi:uncharacterized OB-fold protein